MAIVVSCSDSRLSPEVLFDQGIGDLFAVRTAGHVLDLAGLASIEYAVAHLHVPLLLVLGHSRCGAIFSALTGSLATPSEERLAAAIAPAIAATPVDPDVPLDVRVDRVARTHAAGTATWLLDRSDVLARAAAHHLLVCAGFYDLDSGAVTLLSSASARRE